MAQIHHWLNREHGGTPDYPINNPAWVCTLILGSYIQLKQLPKQQKHPISNSKQQSMSKVSLRLEIKDAAGSTLGGLHSGTSFHLTDNCWAEICQMKWTESRTMLLLRAKWLHGILTNCRVSTPLFQVEGLMRDKEHDSSKVQNSHSGRGSNQRQVAQLRSQNEILYELSFRGCDALKPSTQATSLSTAPFALFHTDAIFVIYKLVYLQQE